MELPLFIIGMSALVRKALDKVGLDTDWTVVAAGLIGLVGYFLSAWYPDIWKALTDVLIGLEAAGLISFGSDMVRKFQPYP